jgi:glutathione peroxidase
MTDNRPSSIYDIDCVDLTGKPLPLRQFAGQPLLIANTASFCGFSKQLADMESLWQRDKNKGLVVLGVPSNDFGQQEPGDSAGIISVCSVKFRVTFPLLAKTPVSGEQAHPLFKWLAHEGSFLSKPRWNFYKYIIGRDGHLKEWFSPFTSPTQPRVARVLTEVLARS